MSKVAIVVSLLSEAELEHLYWVLLEVLSLPITDVELVHLAPNEKPTKEDIETAKNLVTAAVMTSQSRSIVAIGEFPMQVVLGGKNLTKNAGLVTTIELGDVRLSAIPTYSLTDVLANSKKYLEKFARHLDKARNIAFDIPEKQVPTKIVLCDTMEKADLAIKYCQQVGVCCFDFETKEIVKEKVTFEEGFFATSLSLSFQIGSAYVIPLEHFDSPYTKGEVMAIMYKLKEGIFENPKVQKIAHNLKFDWHVLQVYMPTKLRGRIDDTMLMHHLHDETTKQGLKYLVEAYLPEFYGYDTELKGMNWADIPLNILAQYNGVDTDVTLRLWTLFESWLLADPRVYTVYRNLSMGAFRGLWQAEHDGMLIDPNHLEESIEKVKQMLETKDKALRAYPIVQRFELTEEEEALKSALENVQNSLDKNLKGKKERYAKALKVRYDKLAKWKKERADSPTYQQQLDKKVASLEKWKADQSKPSLTELKYRKTIKELKDGEKKVYDGLNFGSPTQLSKLLYDSRHGFKFDTIDRGTGKDVIKALPDETGFVDSLLEYRSLKTTLGTYMVGILKRMDKNNRIHTSFKIAGTVTGRLASANPNLQNLPSISRLQDEDCISAVKMIKESFIVPEGSIICQGDYSQMELRLMAIFAKEPAMLQTYQNDEDLHARGAATMLRISLEEFYKLPKADQKSARTRAKARNFGYIYGMSAKGFQEYAKNTFGVSLTLSEAENERAEFFKMFPKILDYHEEYIQKGSQYGWVRTLLGRRRRLPNINHPDNYLRSSEERYAINSPIQGTGGEFTIFSIGLLYLRLDPRVQIANTIHDSIILYIPKDLIDSTLKILVDTCENPPMHQYFGKGLEGLGMKLDLEVSDTSWKNLQEFELI